MSSFGCSLPLSRTHSKKAFFALWIHFATTTCFKRAGEDPHKRAHMVKLEMRNNKST